MTGTDAVTGPQSGTLDKRIPIVIYADEWGGIGGTAGYVRMLAEGAVARGYRVAVICEATPEMAEFRDALASSGIEVRAVEHGGERSPRGRLARQRWFTRTVREYPGCVLALMMGYFTRGGGVILAGRMGGASAIVRADLTPPDHHHGFGARVGLRIKDALVDRVVVGAHENIRAFGRDVGRSPKKMHVIHTGIELERFVPGTGRDQVRKELGFDDSHVLVGTVSRLSDERKGMRDFVAACIEVAAGAPDARFVVVGDGVLRGELENQAARLVADKRIVFAGWRSDVVPLLAAMDIFVMPSHFEGGPTSVLEAMAMGKAVVATEVGMVPEVIVPNEDGLIVPPANTEALAAAISALVREPQTRRALGGAAWSKALGQFSIDLMVDRYLALFGEHAGKPSRPSRQQL
jgi:glycosyltransferase involved in cell wall biosynthesis